MSTCSYALIPMEFRYVTFDSKEAVAVALEEVNEDIKNYESTLHRLAFMTEPKKFCDEDTDPIYFIDNQYRDAIENLPGLYVKQHAYGVILKTWDKSHHKNGIAIRDYQGSIFDMCRVGGDYVAQCNPDGSNTYPDDEFATKLYNKQIKK